MSEIPTFTGPDGRIYVPYGDYANCTVAACPIEFSVYGYRPSLAASGTLIGLYVVCMVIQIILGWRYRAWAFMAAMLLGCIDEIIGYAGRILYWQDPWGEAGFIIQIVLITLGPVFFSAAIYVLLAQIIKYISVKHSRIPPQWVYYGFIPCDVVSLVLQAAGGALSSTSNGRSSAGVNIALVGLAFQVVTLVAFVGLTVDYVIRSRSVWRNAVLPTRFKVFSAFLAMATLLILIRCCYRVYELSEGYSRESEALRDEPLFIGLESVMIILAAFCLIGAHPGFIFKGDKRHLVSDGPEAGVSSEKQINSDEPSLRSQERI